MTIQLNPRVTLTGKLLGFSSKKKKILAKFHFTEQIPGCFNICKWVAIPEQLSGVLNKLYEMSKDKGEISLKFSSIRTDMFRHHIDGKNGKLFLISQVKLFEIENVTLDGISTTVDQLMKLAQLLNT